MKSRSQKKRHYRTRRIFSVMKMLVARGSVCLFSITCISFYFWGIPASVRQYSYNTTYQLAKKLGYTCENVIVHGVQYTSLTLPLVEGIPLFSIDADKIYAMLMRNDALEYVCVKKSYPKTLMICVQERKPQAIFYDQNNRRFYVDEKGTVFKHRCDFKYLPICCGKEAPQHIMTFMQKIRLFPCLEDKIHIYRYMPSQRFDLLLKDKTLVRLPRENIEKALKRMQAYIDKSSDASVIDLRISDKTVLSSEKP